MVEKLVVEVDVVTVTVYEDELGLDVFLRLKGEKPRLLGKLRDLFILCDTHCPRFCV